MHDWSFGFGMGSMGLVWLIWLLLAGGAVWAVVTMATRRPPPGESPETVLKRRYASGEISREEFERKLADIQR